MKIKKNGVTMNLTESDINKLRKSLLKEGVVFDDGASKAMENSLKNKCINTWKASPGKKGTNNESDWGESWKIVGIEKAPKSRENSWGDKLTIKLDKSGGCENSVKTAGRSDITATMTLVCDKQRNSDSYAFNFTATGRDKENFKDTIIYNQGVSNVIKKDEWCKTAGVEDSPGDSEDEFASTGGQSDQQMSEFRRKYGRRK